VLSIREKVRRVVEASDSKLGVSFDWTIQIFIILSLISFSIETLPNLSNSTSEFLYLVEIASVVVFTAEYLLRLWVSKKPQSFIFSFYGLIDLLAILPFYFSSGLDLRAIRSIRLLRIFRILKLIRYTKAMNRFHRAIVIAWEELVLFFCTTLILLYISAVGIIVLKMNSNRKPLPQYFIAFGGQ